MDNVSSVHLIQYITKVNANAMIIMNGMDLNGDVTLMGQFALLDQHGIRKNLNVNVTIQLNIWLMDYVENVEETKVGMVKNVCVFRIIIKLKVFVEHVIQILHLMAEIVSVTMDFMVMQTNVINVIPLVENVQDLGKTNAYPVQMLVMI